ncbi:hypothetical protein TOK_0442 [Pseudonocardia sp. N23]|nr:hypothetical protein TOK_0442 [Pseudonocardia sp. N23]
MEQLGGRLDPIRGGHDVRRPSHVHGLFVQIGHVHGRSRLSAFGGIGRLLGVGRFAAAQGPHSSSPGRHG